jgi:hypothetical protein
MLLFMALMVDSGGLRAQSSQPEPAPRGNERVADPVQVTGSWRFRTESWDWFDSPVGEGNYVFAGSLLRIGVGQKRAGWEWKVELAQPTLLGLPRTAIAPAPQGSLGLGANYFASNGENAASVFLKQGYVVIRGMGAEGNSLLLGRVEFIEGAEAKSKNTTVAQLQTSRIAHRLIGNFGFSHVGRSFDGVEFNLDSKAGNLTLMAGRATRGVFHVDGTGELDVDVAYVGFTGSTTKSRSGQWRVFGMNYHDGRRTLKTDNRPLATRKADLENIRIGTFGGNMIQTFPIRHGTGDILAWGAWQIGKWGSLDHNAGALALEAGYQLPVRWKPWFRVGWSRSTGDNNAADGTHGSFFQMLPTPRTYARFPFYTLMNNQDVFSQIVLRPTKKLTTRCDVHGLKLSAASDLWYQGGGAYEKSTFGFAGRPSGGSRSLATLFDVSADYQWNKHWTIGGYFADAEGKAVIQKIYPQGTTARLGYGELTLTF